MMVVCPSFSSLSSLFLYQSVDFFVIERLILWLGIEQFLSLIICY